MAYLYFGDLGIVSLLLLDAARKNPRTAAGRKIKSAGTAAGRKIKSVGRSAAKKITAPFRAVEDAAKSAEAAAQAAISKADNALELVRETKRKLEKAKLLAEKYQLTQAHWDRIDRLEAKVNKTIKFLPLTSRLALIKEFSKLLDYAFIAAVVALTGSTLALWFFFGREKKPERPKSRSKKPRKPLPPQEEYIEIAEGGKIPEGYEIVQEI